MPTASSQSRLQPWDILQRHTMEEDWVFQLLTPLLVRSVSDTQEGAADCLEVARLFSETQIVGRPITGHECYHCMQDGGSCMVPARELVIGNTQGIYAVGRCTNCTLSGAACDLPARTEYTECFCDWFMPDADREEHAKWRTERQKWAHELGRPTRDRTMDPAAWGQYNAYIRSKTRLRSQLCLPLPRTYTNDYPDEACWIATVDRFVQAAMPEMWGRPHDFQPVPCSCNLLPDKGAPMVWMVMQVALRARASGQARQHTLVSEFGEAKVPATPASTSVEVHQPEPTSDVRDEGGDEPVGPTRPRRAREAECTHPGTTEDSSGVPRLYLYRFPEAQLSSGHTNGSVALPTQSVRCALARKSEGTEILGVGEEMRQPNPEHCQSMQSKDTRP